MQNCQTCGYDSPAGAKFCRQCGAPLFAESETSGAGTRNYGRQDSAPAVSGPLPPSNPSVVDAFGGDTSRYYQPPVGAVAGTASLAGARPMIITPAYIPPISETTRLRSKWKRRLLKGAAYFALLIGAAGIGAAINEESHNDRPGPQLSSEDRNRIEIARRLEAGQAEISTGLREAQERVRRLLDKRLQTLREARRAAERSAELGSAAVLNGITPVDLTPFEYQNATVGNYIRMPGQELLVQRTKDDFASILQFYQKKLGKPVVIVNKEEDQRLIFQSSSTPSVVVLVENNNEHNQQWEITILRSPFPFPKADEALSVAAAADEAQPSVRPLVKAEPRPAAKPAAPVQPAPNPKEPE